MAVFWRTARQIMWSPVHILHRNPLLLHTHRRGARAGQGTPSPSWAGGTGGSRKRPGQAAPGHHVQVTRSVMGTMSMNWTGMHCGHLTASARLTSAVGRELSWGLGKVCLLFLLSFMDDWDMSLRKNRIKPDINADTSGKYCRFSPTLPH